MCQQKTATAITPTESTPRHRSPPTLYLCTMHRGMSKEPGVHTCWPHSPFPPPMAAAPAGFLYAFVFRMELCLDASDRHCTSAR